MFHPLGKVYLVTFEQDLEERKDVILIYIEDLVSDIIASTYLYRWLVMWNECKEVLVFRVGRHGTRAGDTGALTSILNEIGIHWRLLN